MPLAALVLPIVPGAALRFVQSTVVSSHFAGGSGLSGRPVADFRFTEFLEVQLRVVERSSVRRVMSSSCSHPSPVKRANSTIRAADSRSTLEWLMEPGKGSAKAGESLEYLRSILR
jgi:hypothetical protein